MQQVNDASEEAAANNKMKRRMKTKREKLLESGIRDPDRPSPYFFFFAIVFYFLSYPIGIKPIYQCFFPFSLEFGQGPFSFVFSFLFFQISRAFIKSNWPKSIQPVRVGSV